MRNTSFVATFILALLIASCSYPTSLFQAVAPNPAQVPPPMLPTNTPAAIVRVAQRINIPAGATSTQMTGQIDGTVYDSYLLDARAGLRMQLTLTSTGSYVYLTVIAPSGTPLARAEAGAQSFDQILPEAGDYTIQVSAPAGTALTAYTLAVSVTSQEPAQPSVQRIRFAPGATSAQVTGQIDPNASVSYLLEARAGQRMQVYVTSSTGSVYLTVVSPSGSPLARAQAGAQSMDQTLPENGDYSLQLSVLSSTAQASFTLSVSVTGGQPVQPAVQRIRFAPGATSAQVTGQVDGSTIAPYMLEARAGQRMQVYVTSPGSNVYLTVVSPLGSPLARAQAGAQSMDDVLPETGDYSLQVSAFSGTPLTSFTLTITVTNSQPQPTVQRIRFAPGATSAQVMGQVDGNTAANYVLEARAGQRMQVYVTSPGNNVYLTVVSPLGSPLARAQAGAQSMDQTLPENGDYSLQVSAFSGTPLTSFTLVISIT